MGLVKLRILPDYIKMTAQILKIKLNDKELEILKDKRNSKGYTQGDMAEALKMSRTNYNMFETGYVSVLNYDRAKRIYDLFDNDKDLDFLLCGQEPLTKDSEQILGELEELIKKHK